MLSSFLPCKVIRASELLLLCSCFGFLLLEVHPRACLTSVLMLPGCKLRARAWRPCARGQEVPCHQPKELDNSSLSAGQLCSACLWVAAMLPRSFLPCLLPHQLTPGLPQKPCSAAGSLFQIHGMRKRHTAGMPGLLLGAFLAVDLQRC